MNESSAESEDHDPSSELLFLLVLEALQTYEGCAELAASTGMLTSSCAHSGWACLAAVTLCLAIWYIREWAMKNSQAMLSHSDIENMALGPDPEAPPISPKVRQYTSRACRLFGCVLALL